MANVEALCTSEKKGERKQPVASAVFRKYFGIEGDAHAGSWHRQVSLLSLSDIETVRKNGLPDLKPGDFAENIILSGLDAASFGLGTKVRLGNDVEVSVTQIGKVCHTRCRIYDLTGDCIMPRLGLFARVDTGGTVCTGDSVEMIHHVPRDRIQVVVLTVSDRCSTGETRDTAGPAVSAMLRDALPSHIYTSEIIPDEQPVIEKRLKHFCSGHSIDLAVTVGGTGFSPRDVTPEASRNVIERFTPGLDEAMRASSMRKTPHAMLSRGTSGICGSTLIINLPGSERAAVENLDVIITALQHGIKKLKGDKTDCAGDVRK